MWRKHHSRRHHGLEKRMFFPRYDEHEVLMRKEELFRNNLMCHKLILELFCGKYATWYHGKSLLEKDYLQEHIGIEVQSRIMSELKGHKFKPELKAFCKK
ncbi:hypothetical protein NPIL_328051 [Nephila pilipes]|uniref:Uncharacterized protein n=1 Tax=Nephila pilipes TaxID=299642 RepID=A0A8X6MQC6_NEPPI|nr:hypothetical protein NPIL_328051 [Nephila pilipes]